MKCNAINFHFEHGAFRFFSLNHGSCKNFEDFGSVKPNFPYALILAYLTLGERLTINTFNFTVFIERKNKNKKTKTKTKQNKNKTK